MKFNGVSGVQVRTPSNLADLADYNSMRFYITLTDAGRQRRQNVPDPSLPKQFVFYLGNKDVITTEMLLLCVFTLRVPHFQIYFVFFV